jgi:hypothetical protein
MLLSFLYGSLLVGTGVVVGVALSEHNVLTLTDLRSCRDTMLEHGKKMSRRDYQPKMKQNEH